MKSYETEQMVTTSIHIKSSDIFKTKNINGLISYHLKNSIEGVCGKYGYVVPDSVKVIKRSIGKIITHNNENKTEYDVTYKMRVIYPNKGDKLECNINSITKMGIIAYLKSSNTDDDIKESPILVIIPQEYTGDKSIDQYKEGQSIDITILESRIKYRSTQIQTVGRIES